ncbi:hypothetical protein [Halobacterium wangiae]|uniref:hypothetical protein n=1 Tax=Halobacterium wangiae TaxID=2902623 RepID=UPI001E521967|nr:hypothetical protein [Halobacterium wangiae]
MKNPKLLPLAILYAEDEDAVEGITRFQKLVFMAQRKLDDLEVGDYEFRPDDYGPFSKELYDDIDELAADDYISCKTTRTPSGGVKQTYELNEKGKQFLEFLLHTRREAEEGLQLSEIEALKEQYNDVPLLEFIQEVYDEYPEMAVNSKLNLN